MNKRPTPETDAARHDLSDYGSPVPCSYGDWVPFEVAEKLERERDEAWACCDELVVDSNAITLAKTVMKLERERDEALAAIVGWENKWKCAVYMAAQAEVERDEAREALEFRRAADSRQATQRPHPRDQTQLHRRAHRFPQCHREDLQQQPKPTPKMKLTTENTEDTELKACIKKHAKEILAGFSSEELWRNYAEAVENLCRKLERERDNWEQTAAHYLDGMHYYRGLVGRVGETLGEAAYTQDDGEKVDSVLCAKVPELVEELKRERDEAREENEKLREALLRIRTWGIESKNFSSNDNSKMAHWIDEGCVGNLPKPDGPWIYEKMEATK